MKTVSARIVATTFAVSTSDPRRLVTRMGSPSATPSVAAVCGWISSHGRRGSLVLTAKVVATIRADTVFIPYHWANPVAANQLTIARFDPKSWIPAFKACAVRLERSEVPASPVPAPPVTDDRGRPATSVEQDARSAQFGRTAT